MWRCGGGDRQVWAQVCIACSIACSMPVLNTYRTRSQTDRQSMHLRQIDRVCGGEYPAASQDVSQKKRCSGERPAASQDVSQKKRRMGSSPDRQDFEPDSHHPAITLVDGLIRHRGPNSYEREWQFFKRLEGSPHIYSQLQMQYRRSVSKTFVCSILQHVVVPRFCMSFSDDKKVTFRSDLHLHIYGFLGVHTWV